MQDYTTHLPQFSSYRVLQILLVKFLPCDVASNSQHIRTYSTKNEKKKRINSLINKYSSLAHPRLTEGGRKKRVPFILSQVVSHSQYK